MRQTEVDTEEYRPEDFGGVEPFWIPPVTDDPANGQSWHATHPATVAQPAKVSPRAAPINPVIHWASEALGPQEPIVYVVADVIAESSLTILYGDPGCKKTWAMLDLAVSLANGEPEWIGQKIERCTVLFVDEESGLKRIKDRLHKVQRGHAVTGKIPLAFLTMNGFAFMRQDHIDALQDAIIETGAKLVIIDTLADVAAGAKENVSDEMQPILVALKLVADRTGAAIVVIHHSNKLNGGYRGSSAILGKCDAMIKCESKSGDQLVTLMSEKVRDGSPFKLSALAFFGVDLFNLAPASKAVNTAVNTATPGDDKKLSKSQKYVFNFIKSKGASDLDAMNDGRYATSTLRTAAYDLVDLGLLVNLNEGQTGRGNKGMFDLNNKV